MKYSLLTSLLLHSLLLVCILPRKYTTSIPIEIIVNQATPIKTVGKGHLSSGRRAAQAVPEAPEGELSKAAKEIEAELNNPMEAKTTVYWSFYKRVWNEAFLGWRNDVNGVWQRKKLTRVYQTKLWLILSESGMVEQIMLVQSSGVPELDAAAIKAFTGRFIPHPPKTLVDKDGKIRLLWTFTVG